MQIAKTILEVRNIIIAWRKQGLTIGLIPTMGNIHDGHLSLVTAAKPTVDRIVTTIFVNPMQFGKNEDFSTYPRTPEDDIQKFTQAEVDLLFMPDIQEIYPNGLKRQTRVEVPELSSILCGASREGHFSGVTTVVSKLLNIVLPDKAFFGEKDFQQLMLIKQMVKDLCMPFEIISVPFRRDFDGLAMSSRNSYLTPEQRKIAPQLFQILQAISERIKKGEKNYFNLSEEALMMLQKVGFEPEYMSIRSQDNFGLASEKDKKLIILAAAKLGKTRLIDNLTVSLSE